MQLIRDFLPVSREDMKKRNIEQLDFVYVIGDAYVDHHSFGPAVISRVLESKGYTVGIISQPDWKDEHSIQILGKPRLAFLVSSGNMDSMVNHYTSAKKRRNQDAYTPGGVIGKRPDRAVIVYGNLIRKVYKDVPIIIGGIEASLRRLAHYDYWSDKVRRSILIESGADLCSYGMGEHSIVEIADALSQGIPVKEITFVRGTVFRSKYQDVIPDAIHLPDYRMLADSEIGEDRRKRAYADSFAIQYENTDPFTAKALVEKYGEAEYVIQNPPAYPLTTEEMDAVYELPYMRTYHPSYEKAGGVPAITELKFSLTSCRGCYGSCNFCALTFHQGRIIQTRSHDSLIREAKIMIREKDFKGYINDVGGPTANFYHPSCEKQLTRGTCKNRQCLFPTPCKNLNTDHSEYLSLLRKLRKLDGVKKVFVRSGLRFDYILADKNDEFFEELCEHHISGQLKVAPEHISDQVLKYMGKPENSVYERFREKYRRMNERKGKKQFIVPYLMSSHPGSTLKEAVKLAEYIRDLGYMPEQVQDFYPTPSTLSTCMYYTGIHPITKEKVYVPTSYEEKAMQRALIQYRNPANYKLVKEALCRTGRTDLIGYGKKCLIPPDNTDMINNSAKKGQEKYSTSSNISNRKRENQEKYQSSNWNKSNRNQPKSGASDYKKKPKKTIRNIHKAKKK